MNIILNEKFEGSLPSLTVCVQSTHFTGAREGSAGFEYTILIADLSDIIKKSLAKKNFFNMRSNRLLLIRKMLSVFICSTGK